jgi:hypothetical protein
MFSCPQGETPKAAIAPAGKVTVGTYADDAPEVCSGLPARRYSVAALTTALRETFELVETRREQHITPRSVMQPFTWVAGSLG